MIKLQNILNKKSTLKECIIAHTVLNGKVLLAKNRDRAYTAKVTIVRELIGDVELVYILDKDTDWSEGMNNQGLAIINSALMVNADEKEKKLIKKKGKPSEDGLKIRKALSYKNPSESLKSIVNYDKIVRLIKKLVKNKHYNFLETLAEDTFDELFKDKRIGKIMLKIGKLEILKECSSVGIQITKKRSHDKL